MESAQEDQGGVERLFFELASESRLGILRQLLLKPLRTQDIAHSLGLTDTEAFRQTHRLGEASLIQKQPDGTYGITQYGKLVLQLSGSLEFAYKYRECLMTRDIWAMPDEFINRFSELSNAKLNLDVLDSMNKADQVVLSAEKFIWTIGNSPLDSIGSKIAERFSHGVSLRLMFHEKLIPMFKDVPEIEGKIEKRALSSTPGTMLLTEKSAGVSFASIDGRADYALFFSMDPVFMKWAKDLFEYYWDRGKLVHPEIKDDVNI